MKKLMFLFFTIPFVACAQSLEISKATEQTIIHGVSPTSTTNYIILLKKQKTFKWSIDSVYAVADKKKVKYNSVKVDDPNVTSPNYQKLEKFDKKYKGLIQITFANTKSLGDRGRPNTPKLGLPEPVDYSAGVIIYFTIKNKKKELIVNEFEKLEKINAP